MTWAEFGMTLGISCAGIALIGTVTSWLVVRLLDS